MSDDRYYGVELSPEEYLARLRGARIDPADLAARYGQDGRAAPDALSVQVIQERLEAIVYMVLSMRRSVRPAAEALAWFPGARVEALFGHIERVTRTSLDLAYHLCVHAPEMLRHLPDEAIHEWVISLLDTYDRSGTQGAIRAMQAVADHAERLRDRHATVRLGEIQVVLDAFLNGLAGRRLTLQVGDDLYTDTETLFLPARLVWFADAGENFRLYKAMIAHHWAQTWFGTWREPVSERLAQSRDPGLTLALVRSAECLRLDARLAIELPGLWREMQRLAARPPLPPAWARVSPALRAPTADAGVSWRVAEQLLARRVEPLEPVCYEGEWQPQRVAEIRAARLAREQAHLREALAVIADELGGNLSRSELERPSFDLLREPDTDWPDGFAFQLVLGDQPVRPSHEVRQLMHSIVQDFGTIPAEYLEAAGVGLYHRKAGAADGPEEAEASDAPGAHLRYDEWDYSRQAYRRGWCQLMERGVHPQPDAFVETTLRKYAGLLKHLHRTFEALRGEERMIRREPFGEDPDLDALVEAYADLRRGAEMTECLFQRRRKLERDLAVLFMVDMSGSTKGWINEVERESLVLLCESIERLGDRYAIFGFSGRSHACCEIFPVKAFDEPYADPVKARISGIRPRDYTRMGVAIRHLTKKLACVDARTRVLMVLDRKSVV